MLDVRMELRQCPILQCYFEGHISHTFHNFVGGLAKTVETLTQSNIIHLNSDASGLEFFILTKKLIYSCTLIPACLQAHTKQKSKAYNFLYTLIFTNLKTLTKPEESLALLLILSHVFRNRRSLSSSVLYKWTPLNPYD